MKVYHWSWMMLVFLALQSKGQVPTSMEGYLQQAGHQFEQGSDSVFWYTEQALHQAQTAEEQGLVVGQVKSYWRAAILAGNFDWHQRGFEQLYAFSQRIRSDSLAAISLYGLAVGEHTLGQHLQALRRLKTIDTLLVNAQLSPRQVVTIQLLRAELHSALQQHAVAIQAYIAAIKTAEQHDELVDKRATGLNGLSLLHYDQGNIKKALEYAKEALKVSELTEQLPRVAIAHMELAKLYLEQGDTGSTAAKQHMSQALALATESEYLPVVGVAYLNLGIWHQANQQLDSTEYYLQQASAILEQVGDQGNLLRAYMQLAELHQQYSRLIDDTTSTAYRQQLESTARYAQQAYEGSQALGVVEVELASAQLLAKTHAQLGNFAPAYRYLNAYQTQRDALLDAEKIRIVEEAEAEFQAEKKQLQIDLLEADQARRQTVLYLIGAGLILTLAFLVGLWWLYRQKQEANQQLATQNQLIATQNNTLEQRNEEKALLLKEIHHRVKNNLQVISSLLELQSKGIEDSSAALAIEDGQSRIRSMALIHHKLYQNEELSAIHLPTYTEQLLQQILATMTYTSPSYELAIPDEVYLDIDTAIPLGLILNELITNACKYAFREGQQGQLAIGLRPLGGGEYALTVADNGPGLPKAFDFRKARSLGLRLVRRLSKQLLGKATYHYEQGSVFTISFKDTVARKAID